MSGTVYTTNRLHEVDPKYMITLDIKISNQTESQTIKDVYCRVVSSTRLIIMSSFTERDINSPNIGLHTSLPLLEH